MGDANSHHNSDHDAVSPLKSPVVDHVEKNTRFSKDLQDILDTCQDPLYHLQFSFTMADPMQEDCPIIACSMGFSELTGYSVPEIVGKNCRFLLDGVPYDLIDQETRMKARTFCGVMREDVALSRGKLICVQTNATKCGKLFRNMFYMMEIVLDDNKCVVALQAELSEDLEEDISKLQDVCQQVFQSLDKNMSVVHSLLASQFWFSAPLRRELDDLDSLQMLSPTAASAVVGG
jgi:hypothetical protein